jgi:hypothetical protein
MVVDVDLSSDLEVMIPLEIPMIFDLRFWIYGFQSFSLCYTSPLPAKFS